MKTKILLTIFIWFSILTNIYAIDIQMSTTEIAKFDSECNSGNEAVCVMIGSAYENGDSVKQDISKANIYYAKVKNPFYYFDLGRSFYFAKNATLTEYKRARSLFKKACDGGDTKGCVKLGFMYENGTGVKQDNFKAVELYKKACNAGNARGCFNLGLMYKDGIGVKQDNFKAVKLYKKACDGGDAIGCLSLGFMYENGTGVKQNNFKAKELYGKACDGKIDLGCEWYAKLNKT